MDIVLQPPMPPVIMLSGHLIPDVMTFQVHCHDSSFKKVTAVDATGKELFRVEGPSFGTSWSWRRKVFDATDGKHLFDFRHETFNLKNGWLVEDPSGRKLCSLAHRDQVTATRPAVNATFHTVMGVDAMVVMQPQDHHGAPLTLVHFERNVIAVIRKSADSLRAIRGNQDKSVWDVDVAGGADLTVVSRRNLIHYYLC